MNETFSFIKKLKRKISINDTQKENIEKILPHEFQVWDQVDPNINSDKKNSFELLCTNFAFTLFLNIFCICTISPKF